MLFRVQAIAGHLEHGAGVQRDIRARPGILGRGEVICIDFASGLKHNHFNAFRYCIVGGKPLGISPRLQNRFCLGVAGIGFLCHIVECIKYQQCTFQLFGSLFRQLCIVQQANQCSYVVAAVHIAQQADGSRAVNQWRGGFAIDNGAEEAGFDVGCFVHTRGYAVGNQVEEKFLFTSRRVLQQFNQSCGPLRIQWFRWNILFLTFSDVSTIGF